MASILLLDNYDSFTYNLFHYVEEFGKHSVDVVRNDSIEIDEVAKYDGIILSPGPGLPKDAGLLMPIIKEYYKTKRIFGVCLGLQAIAESFGAALLNLETVFHGVATPMRVLEPKHYLFDGVEETFLAGRYHSWVVDPASIPDCLAVNAIDEHNQIMAMAHKQYDVCGVQYHPESILTPKGKLMIFNWLERF
ncbi:anthranilate synthase component II [Tenuifilum thalassicum]|jgi:anthranilate synthase component 2|uniref:Aminodeoxychorismate/anthranilate synthase component II n=1 Tax=Tenuifilum thalassicum TaxID=2590900 RepID=A0A7D4CS58_9BACT|nr:aminodeoxychorismate/anthranilate synthase component II [Tenuifilum thalassicum]QKG80605.1 aminodeoxychorismate/anthranilate synthase component II [Tenuifilum thalassicum]